MKLRFYQPILSEFFRNDAKRIWLCYNKLRKVFPQVGEHSSFDLYFSTRPFTGSKRLAVDHITCSIAGHHLTTEDFANVQKLIGSSMVIYVRATNIKKCHQYI